MALSLIEVNYLQSGNKINPKSISFFDLCALMVKRQATYFLSLTKDTSGNADAESYRQKVSAIARRAINNDSSLFQIAHSNVCMGMYTGSETYADLTGFSDAQWETLVTNAMPIVFDLLADVTVAEKNAWNGIPNS